jgi:hypothetical protein
VCSNPNYRKLKLTFVPPPFLRICLLQVQGVQPDAAAAAAAVPAAAAAAPPAPAAGGSVWQVHHTAEGRAYYYNSSTGVTQWEAPGL